LSSAGGSLSRGPTGLELLTHSQAAAARKCYSVPKAQAFGGRMRLSHPPWAGSRASRSSPRGTAQFCGNPLPLDALACTIRINTYSAKHRFFGNSPVRMRGPAGRPRCVVFARRRPQVGCPTIGLSPMEIPGDKTLRQLVCAQVQSPEHDRSQARSATQQKWDYVAKNAFRDRIPIATKPKAPGRSRLSAAASVPLPSPLALATSPTAAPVPGSCESHR
jgi:hypothetical protein